MKLLGSLRNGMGRRSKLSISGVTATALKIAATHPIAYR